MNRLDQKRSSVKIRKARVRAVVSGTAARPRLSVSISNHHVAAQIIDDEAGKTLAAVSTVGKKSVGTTMSEKAAWVGGELAKKATAKKVKQVAFDRNGMLYHGRVQKLADAAREAGLEF